MYIYNPRSNELLPIDGKRIIVTKTRYSEKLTGYFLRIGDYCTLFYQDRAEDARKELAAIADAINAGNAVYTTQYATQFKRGW